MKNYIFLMVGLILSYNVIASDPIEQSVNEFRAITKFSDYYNVLNRFERIISFNDTSWICYYYSSLCLLNIAMNSPLDKIDQICDKADKYIDKADKLSPDNSEIFCLKALSVSVRIRVDGQNRGYKYVTLSNSYLEKAALYDSLNPRVFYLKARNIENIPVMIGGGISEAIPYYKKALDLYSKQNYETLEPTWGRSRCEEVLSNYNNK